MLLRYFSPDFDFSTFSGASVQFLNENGIRALILDIDNTLAPYEDALPSEEVLEWFSDLKAAGIRAAFVSNNHRERVELFNRELGLPCYPEGKKPLRRSMRLAMRAMDADPQETAIMGDQIFTDVWAGRMVGIRTILVPPIRDKRNFLTRFKRWLEKPILKRYRKRKEKE